MKKIKIGFLGGESRFSNATVNYLYDINTDCRCIYAECAYPETPECDPDDPENEELFEGLEDWKCAMLSRMYHGIDYGYEAAADEMYGYLAMKRAILEQVPEDVASRIEWPYDDDDVMLDCPQASAVAPVRVEIHLDNLPADDDEEERA